LSILDHFSIIFFGFAQYEARMDAVRTDRRKSRRKTAKGGGTYPFCRLFLACTLAAAFCWDGALAARNPVLHLGLEQCIEIALSRNRGLRTTKNTLSLRERSLAAAAAEFDVKFFPGAGIGAFDGNRDLSAGLTAKKRFTLGPELSLSPRAGTLDDSYSSEVGVSLDIPLFRNFGKEINLDGIRSSEYGVRAAGRSLCLARADTILLTVSAVYRIVGQNERAAISRSQVKRLKTYTELARAREKVNLASPIDVYRALIRLRDAESRLSVALEALDEAHDELKIILGLPVEREIRVQAPLELKPVAMDPEEAVEAAMEHRIEIAQGRDALDEARRRSRLARQRILPDVRLRMGYSRYGRAMDAMGDLNLSEDTWRVMLTTASDLFRTDEKIGYQKSLYEVENARLSLQSSREGIQKEVRRTLKILETAMERVKISEKQIHEARGKMVLAEVKFNHGLADNFDLIEAETELQQAQVSLVANRIDYIVGRYRLRDALGTLVPCEDRLLP
jgi:outer membrane protein TolC